MTVRVVPPKCAAHWPGAVELPPEAHALFDALRAERARLAKSQGVPPYVVFQDVSLRAMAMERPQTLDHLIGMPGVGQAKLERYGAEFLAVLRADGPG